MLATCIGVVLFIVLSINTLQGINQEKSNLYYNDVYKNTAHEELYEL